MTNDELTNAIKRALSQSLTASSELEEDQGDALDLYYGRPYGNEMKGRSQIVTRDVLESIEWKIPSLMRVFASGSKTVQFDPVTMNDEEAAEQETKVINHVFNKDNEGFDILHCWFKDALLQKIGYVKIYWDEEEEAITENYSGVTDEGLVMLLEDGEPVEHRAYDEMSGVDEMGQPVMQTFHDIKIKRIETSGKLKIENIPQEEMRVSKNCASISLNDTDFVAHVSEKTASDLIEMGYDKKIVDQLGGDDGESSLNDSRSSYEEDDYSEYDNSMRLITVNECYIRIDHDDDGIAELRRVVTSGNTVLDNDEWDLIPFSALTPIPMPHKHIGLSEVDLVEDVQKIKSGLMRQMLDNLNLTNNPEKEVLSSQVNMDDLLTSIPGGIKRVKQMGSIREIVVPFTAGNSLPMLEILDGMKESRTGVSRHTMGLDADVLAQSTKGAFQTGLKQANQRIEMLARVFAETGVKDLFLKMHSLLIKHQDKAREMKVDNEWISINPAEWRERKSMSVVVGVGTSDRSEALANLGMIIEKQELHLMQGSPLVTMKNLFNSYEKVIELAELKDIERYFTDPENQQQQQPEQQPDPQADIIQAQLAIEQQKAQLEAKRIEIDAMAKQAAHAQKEKELIIKEREITLKEQEAMINAEIERAKLNKEDTSGMEAIEAARIKAGAEIEKARIDATCRSESQPQQQQMPDVHIHQGGKKKISVRRTQDGLEGMSEDYDDDREY